MDKTKIKYAYFDLDGTLLNHDKQLSPKTISAIETLKKNNIKVGIATGRPYYMCKNIIELLKPDLPFISINGCLKYDSYNNVVEAFNQINQKSLKPIIDFLYQNKINFLAYSKTKMYYSNLDLKSEWINYVISTIEQQPKKHQWDFTLYPNDEKNINSILKILILLNDSPKEKIDMLKKQLQKYDDVYCVPSQKHLLDIMPVGINKGVALKTLEEKGIINLDKTIVFGDSFNDIEMFRVAKFSVAMSDAPLELKNESTFIAKPNYEEGIFEFINEFF